LRRLHFRAASRAVAVVLSLAGVVGAAGDTWRYKSSMPTARGFVSGCVLEGKIYVIGGFPTPASVSAAVERYDPVTDTWSQRANMPAPRRGHATCAWEGKIYVFGGASPDAYDAAQKNVYVYDPPTDTWTQRADMPYANFMCGVAVVGPTIYLVGGTPSASSPPVARLMAYDPRADSWTRKADMPTARSYLSACTAGGQVYAIGGAPQDYRTLSYHHVEAYDPATNTWMRRADMPTARAAVSTCVVDGKIFALGGYSSSSACPVNELYDPVADVWAVKTPMQQKRLMPFAGSVGDKVYVIGGSYPSAQMQPVALATTEEYDTGLGRSPDLNGDGQITIEDLVLLIEQWGRGGPLGDIAPLPWGDGVVDAQDLEVLMSYWGQEIPDPALIAHWKLDETTGLVAADSAGSNPGTLLGDPLWQAGSGKIGGALRLDGADDYMETPFVLNPAAGPFSVFAWIKGGSGGQAIVSQAGGAHWLLVAPDGTLMTELKEPGRKGKPLTSPAVVTEDAWHRVGFVWDGSNRILYVDGVEVARDTQASLAACAGGLYLGVGGTLATGSYWSGLIDDVRIYDRAVKR